MVKALSTLQEDFLRYLAARNFNQEPKGLYEPVHYMMGLGGKRLRPVLLLLGYQLFAEEVEEALAPALAIEVFHNFTLVHDDIMDQAPLRRGKDTVHHRYGLNTGILSGDVMLIRAYELLAQTPRREAIPDMLDLFNRVAREVCEGQQRDMDFERRSDVSVDEYLLMIEQKTAVLLAGALQLGVIAAGGPQADGQRLYDFGRYLGLAFQIQDDLLDAFGDPEKVGKKVGGDIAQNKKTLLALKALEMASPEQRESLLYWYGLTDPNREAEKILEVKEIFVQTGVVLAAERLKETYQEKAFQNLEAVQAAEARKAPLKELARLLFDRES